MENQIVASASSDNVRRVLSDELDGVVTPRRRQGLAAKFKSALATIGIGSTPTRGEKKHKRSPAPGDDQPVTTGVMKEALQSGLQASLSTFADAVSSSLEELEGRSRAHDDALEQQGKEIDGLKERIVQLEAAHTTVDSRVDKLEESHSGQPHAGNDASNSGNYANVASSGRLEKWAVIGNLGWDTPAEELLSRAKEALRIAQIAETEYSMLQPMRAPGSACSLRFNESSDLDDARKKVRSIVKSYRQDGKPVWLDRQKSEQELRPGRQLNKSVALVKEHLESIGSTAIASADHRGIKKVLVSGVIVATVTRAGLVWKTEASAHIAQDVREEISFAVSM